MFLTRRVFPKVIFKVICLKKEQSFIQIHSILSVLSWERSDLVSVFVIQNILNFILKLENKK